MRISPKSALVPPSQCCSYSSHNRVSAPVDDQAISRTSKLPAISLHPRPSPLMSMPGRPEAWNQARCASGYHPGASTRPPPAWKVKLKDSPNSPPLASMSTAQPPSATANAPFELSKKRSPPPPIQSPLSLTIVIDHGPVKVDRAWAEMLTNTRLAIRAAEATAVQMTRCR